VVASMQPDLSASHANRGAFRLGFFLPRSYYAVGGCWVASCSRLCCRLNSAGFGSAGAPPAAVLRQRLEEIAGQDADSTIECDGWPRGVDCRASPSQDRPRACPRIKELLRAWLAFEVGNKQSTHLEILDTAVRAFRTPPRRTRHVLAGSLRRSSSPPSECAQALRFCLSLEVG
jgi:hypothetical protein